MGNAKWESKPVRSPRPQSAIDKQKAAIKGKPRPKISDDTKKKIVDDWRTGQYINAELAEKYKISHVSVSKLIAGVEKDLLPVVTNQMQMFRELAGLSFDEQELVFSTAKAKCEAIELVNFGMTKAAAFLINKINLQASVGELVGVTQGLKNVRDVVDPVPKQQTNVVVNQTQMLERSVRDLSDADFAEQVESLFQKLRVIN